MFYHIRVIFQSNKNFVDNQYVKSAKLKKVIFQSNKISDPVI